MNVKNNTMKLIEMLCDKFDLKQIVDFHTRISKTSETKIDLVITNNDTKVICEPIANEKMTMKH